MVVRSGLADLTIAKMSDLRGLVRKEWIAAYVLDRSPCPWVETSEPSGQTDERGGDEEEDDGMEIVRGGDDDYDQPLMSSFVEACGLERKRREARGSRSSRGSTETPTAALARLAVEREEAMDPTPSEPPSLPESSGGSTRGSVKSAGARSRGSAAGSKPTSTGTNVLDSADVWFEEQQRLHDMPLLDAPAPPTPAPGDPPRPHARHTKPILDTPNPSRNPPPPPTKKRDLSARNAPLMLPKEGDEGNEKTKK